MYTGSSNLTNRESNGLWKMILFSNIETNKKVTEK